MLTRLQRSHVSPVRLASPFVMVALGAERVSQTQKTRSPTWRGPSIVSAKRATLKTPSRRQRQHTASSGTGLPETTEEVVRGSAMAYGRPARILRPRHTLCVRRQRTRVRLRRRGAAAIWAQCGVSRAGTGRRALPIGRRICSTGAMELAKSADGTRIAFTRVGEGHPVVIVGGAFSTSDAGRGN